MKVIHESCENFSNILQDRQLSEKKQAEIVFRRVLLVNHARKTLLENAAAARLLFMFTFRLKETMLEPLTGLYNFFHSLASHGTQKALGMLSMHWDRDGIVETLQAEILHLKKY